MKRFKTKNKKNRYIEVVAIIIVIVYILLRIYNKNISSSVVDLVVSKTDEINTLLIKKDILPEGKISDLLKINLNDNEEIIYVETDYNEAYRIMRSIVKKIQDNILLFEQGDISGFVNNRELHSYNGNLYLVIPLGYSLPGVLLSNFGPKIPILISMYEHVLGNIETEIVEYGINNALLNVTLTLYLEQKLLMPYREEKVKREYRMVLGSKVINGKVPSFYNGNFKTMSSMLDIS